MSRPLTLHIINHTHWDREWFLTAEYTSRWIPRLVERLEQLVAANPGFRYLFDGQTLVIEDLLAIEPGLAGRVRALLSGGHLHIGPYYCQPDWRLSGGELLLRNLQLGLQDQQKYGGGPPAEANVAWLVDTFGHIGQAPQLHRLFGIEAAFVWRGAPRLDPYFTWQGPDGSDLFTVNLFGGYRNLYGVTHAPQVAVRRLLAEVQKLRPYYPTPDLPLFDGYDLEDDPEDPVRFYTERLDGDEQRPLAHLRLQESTPAAFAAAIKEQKLALPVVHGELGSGKYGATFPGTLSARSALKLMAYDCERLLFSRVEPLAALAHLRGRPYPAARSVQWARLLLQNAVHDCICGVSIDLVHEKMAHSYQRLFREMQGELQGALQQILADFQSGDYAVSTNPFPAAGQVEAGGALYEAETNGAGVWPVAAPQPLPQTTESASRFTWQNDHYLAHIDGQSGAMRLGSSDAPVLGQLVVRREQGDAYSTEPAEQLGCLLPTSPLAVARHGQRYAAVAFDAAWRSAEAQVWARVRLCFDASPFIRWQIDLDSAGAGLRVDFALDECAGEDILAGMPFELVSRAAADLDLLPRELSAPLADILLGQRELGVVRDFPFHDMLCTQRAPGASLAIFARGLRAYRVSADGQMLLPLRRAVQWLTAPNLRHRVGDAGPYFYVPGARCERRVRHELAIAPLASAPDALELVRLSEAYHNPPLIVRVQGRGARRRWPVLQEELPLSALAVQSDRLLARFYNPASRPQALSRTYRRATVWGHDAGTLAAVAPGEIATLLPAPEALPLSGGRGADVRLLNPPAWRVSTSRSRPDPAVLETLEQQAAALQQEVAALEAGLAQAAGSERLRLQHRTYVLQREALEHRLSLALNRRRLQLNGVPDESTLYTVDPEIADIGHALNRLRIKRRIYDYVVQAL